MTLVVCGCSAHPFAGRVQSSQGVTPRPSNLSAALVLVWAKAQPQTHPPFVQVKARIYQIRFQVPTHRVKYDLKPLKQPLKPTDNHRRYTLQQS